MSEKKKKIKKIIISVLIVTLIATAVCVFLVTRNSKKDKKVEPTITPVNQLSTIDAQISSDIINQKVCQEYNGNYKFFSVAEISFTEKLSLSEEYQVYRSITGSKSTDKNTFIHYLNQQNNYGNTNKTLTLVNGKYTKSIGTTNVESGLFFGNLDKSIIFLNNPNGTTIIDERPYSESFEISETGYWLSKNISESFSNSEIENDLDLIFIREKFFYGNEIQKYFYVTYAYQMI